MPSIVLNARTVSRLIGKEVPLKKLKESISMLGTGLESIEGDEIHVEIFPNRPDLLSEQGLARALSSYLGVKTGLREYEVEKSSYELIVDKSVEHVRPCTACAVVKGIHFDDEKIKEVIQIQEKLHVTHCRNRKKGAIGIYPMEAITFPITFKAAKPREIRFRPLEAAKEMDGLQILSQHPAGREYGYLLEGMDRFPYFVDAKGKVLSIPPIINSHETGKITEKTRDVFIECSGFDYGFLRKMLNMIVAALADMGGKIYGMRLEYKHRNLGYGSSHMTYMFQSPDMQPEKMKYDLAYINRIVGLELSKKEFETLVKRMGYGMQGEVLLVPSYRADVLHMIDIAEDVAIAYGYDKLKPVIPKVATIGNESQLEVFKQKLADIMIGAGYHEVKTYSLLNKDDQGRKMNKDDEVVKIKSSVSEEYNSLRAWMIPSLMKVLEGNKHHPYPQQVFDAGTVFSYDDKQETKVGEKIRLGVVSCHEDANFTEAKQILDIIMNAIGIGYGIEQAEHSSFIPGRVGRISVKGKKVGYVGEIAPNVLSAFGIEFPVAALELNVGELFESIDK